MDTDLKSPIQTDSTSTTSKLILLVQRLIHDIWASPINLLLAALILCLLVKLFLLKRKPSNNSSQKQAPVQLPKMPKCDFTIQELRGYNGIESNGRILTAIYGDIFDVSRRSDLYGIGTLTNINILCIKKDLVIKVNIAMCLYRTKESYVTDDTLEYMLTRIIIERIFKRDR
jgi:predicted heme/steroid binding protein